MIKNDKFLEKICFNYFFILGVYSKYCGNICSSTEIMDSELIINLNLLQRFKGHKGSTGQIWSKLEEQLDLLYNDSFENRIYDN
ncbi:hypothetical protein BpHYR1_040326 [Brachionus plicatilis]|uniref:Uncharacterized protein n=1 Tax=Brachionus plicatilis TaxID=10195 RepID=A0A3M7PP58_BRAPC|nr:hypothetical protein BpHYR1_040326 [Brachionus plicatilis]